VLPTRRGKILVGVSFFIHTVNVLCSKQVDLRFVADCGGDSWREVAIEAGNPAFQTKASRREGLLVGEECLASWLLGRLPGKR
jgi:hypothetical protein